MLGTSRPLHFSFLLKFDTIDIVEKITAEEFTDSHKDLISSMHWQQGNLSFKHKEWKSLFLGAGEEKAVCCVRDHNGRVFALELIDNRTYREGRLIGGEYFFDINAGGLQNVALTPGSAIGLRFSGLVKVREFIYGYEVDRFRFDAAKAGVIDHALTSYLSTCLSGKRSALQQHHRDTHDRNFVFELRSPRDRGWPVMCKDWDGKIKVFKVGLQGIDLRPG